ncbi:branched-chain amino acid ABC transporter permease [Xanthobacter sp.]|uniref:branched-chain amino acid ABC transporter permease n=1 Tax=Xanthobacter sp. TaxID=35809 RepID=UPI0025EA8378|nr:branched-chain amino acid ABC transporter permease [Xanthobacter sp.]
MKSDFYDILRSPFWWGALLVLAAAPFLLPSYYLHIATLTLVYVALASAWNIVGGIGGQISLAHSLFVGTGAMLASALLLKLGINMWLGMIIAAMASGLMGALISFIDHRFRLGHLSFALITLAFAEMGEIIVIGWEFLGGASGLLLPRDTGNIAAFQFGPGRGMFWVMLTLAAVSILANLAILNLPLGYRLRTIRDNENAAEAIGVNLLRNKTIAMVVSAMLASIIGTAYARYLTFADPYQLASPLLTVEIVLVATVGGLGRAFGPAVGALLLIPLGEVLRGKLGGVLPGLHYFVYGAVVIGVILASPRGLLPLIQSWFRTAATTKQNRTPVSVSAARSRRFLR